jgi:hypothetical protein
MQTEPIDIVIALTHTWWFKGPLLIVGVWLFLGMKFIRERQVGIVVKRFGMRNLPAGQIIALRGEAGLQADVLSPAWALKSAAMRWS